MRATPFCPVFGSCGGCQVQHFAYEGQLRWKTDMVRNALTRIGGFSDVTVRDAIGMVNPRHYRNKMSLVVEQRGGTPTIGFYKQRSHDVVAIDGCPIVTPQLDEFIGRLNEARKKPETAEAFRVARHIVSRNARATGEAVVTFTTPQQSQEVDRAGPALLAQLPGAVGLTNSFDPNSENAIMGRRQQLVFGRPEIEEQIAGVRYRVSASSFFQVNVEIVERIFSVMRAGLQDTAQDHRFILRRGNVLAVLRQAQLRRLRHRGELSSDPGSRRKRGTQWAAAAHAVPRRPRRGHRALA